LMAVSACLFIITPKLNYTRAAPQDRYSIPTIRGLALYGGLFLSCSILDTGQFKLVTAVLTHDFMAFQLVPCVREDVPRYVVLAVVLRA
jgi:hypothetical protein